MKKVKFLDQDCVAFSNGRLSILVTQSVGPRVISLKLQGGENIFAELPDTTLDCPGKGDFHLYGGHRLWHAPEEPSRTYLPDDDPLEVTTLEDGLRLRPKLEAETNIQKEIRLQFQVEQAAVRVEHILTNQGVWPVTLAPWAITQMRPGGVALLPQNRELWEGNPTLPNRPLTLWPYTDINSPHIRWGNQVILIQADVAEGHLKIGFPNPRGWLAYWWSGILFVKRATFQKGATYFDFGSSSECYCGPNFLELETLGPKTMLNPGESTRHLETWELYSGVSWPEDLDVLVDLIENKGG